jgi:RsiW-degrading membrane proteinase PrsW (M82 family)
MTNSQLTHDASGEEGQFKLAIIAGVAMLLSAGVFIASQSGVMPAGIGTTIVLIGIGITLKMAWSVASKSAGSAQRARLTRMMSNAGLIVAVLSAVAAVPRLTKAGGVGHLAVDLAAQLWTLAILLAAAGPARTLGRRALLGAFLLGFMGLISLSRLIGRPVIVAMGANNLFAAAIWVPLTEEMVKLLPMAFMLFFALRRSNLRPSLLDVVLLTGCAGGGFALAENAMYGRGAFSLSAAPVVSWLVPAANKGTAYGWTVVQSGHLLHSALIALAIGFVVLYRGRLKRAWIAAAVAVGAVLFEHCSQNGMIAGGLNRQVSELFMILTLGGRLCTLLFAAGLAYAMTIEWRAFAPLAPASNWLRLSAQEANTRERRLALIQVRGSGG